MIDKLKIEVKKIRNKWFVVAGVAKLDRFNDEASATEALTKNAALYEYWANSAGVIMENTQSKVVTL